MLHEIIDNNKKLNVLKHMCLNKLFWSIILVWRPESSTANEPDAKPVIPRAHTHKQQVIDYRIL